LTFQLLEGLSVSGTETDDDGNLPMRIDIATEEFDLKSSPCCGWLMTNGWGGKDMVA